MPVRHRLDKAQVDFGHAMASESNQLRKFAVFVTALPNGDEPCVRAFALSHPIITAPLNY